MATAPPPYSREARRQARQAARAQRWQWRAAARAQRDYYRQAWHGMRRPSFVGPVILLAIGIVALLIELGRLDPVAFWGWYARWWPLLLIGTGVLLLVEYLLDRKSPWAGRRSVGGLVWLVILLMVLGWIAHRGRLVGPFASQFSGDNGGDFWNWMGAEHDRDVQLDAVLTAAKPAVTIDDPQGNVTIAASGDGQVHVRAHERVHRDSNAAAQKIFAELQPKIEVSESGAAITVPEKSGAGVDLHVELPAAALTTVTAGHGDVTADGLNGSVQVTAHHGDVKLDDLGGDAQAHMDHGDFSAHNVQGHVLVNGQGDDVTLTQIAGPVTLDGAFFGDIHLEQIGGAVQYHSNMTSLDIPRLVGSLTLDSGDLSVSQASGPMQVTARSKDMELTQIAGDAHIEDSNGDVDVTMANPLGNVQITDHTGDVVVTMPEHANFSVSGSTSGDEEVRTDFPLQKTTQGGRQILQGTVGHGGVQLRLETDHGDLELRKGENATLAVTAPAAGTEAAETGAKAAAGAAKHFHAPTGVKPQVKEE
jgi:DUF4097 and DUF4098 domain-containing protein YvlB